MIRREDDEMKGASLNVLLSLSMLIFVSCRNEDKVFRSVPSLESGIEFVNTLNPTDSLNILTYLYYYNGGGVVIADFNNDNLNDIYLASNQGEDKLYLNRGDLKFEDITVGSGIRNSEGWTTGVTHIDINNDGLLDIYVCKVGAYKSIKGKNLLFVNQGIGEGGVPFFKEDAQSFGLDIATFSTQAAFFDFDLDGDLDMFLLTHSVHPNHAYGRGVNRVVRDSLTGDRLFENVNGKFVDVTEPSGIFQSRIGYGLGIAIGDLNKDGFPDIYIGNDFFENDYFYRNNGDKTFSELISTDSRIFGHTSHYSMGNCMADLNNDGRLDIVSLDMLPEDLITLKSSGVEDGYSTYNQYLNNGYSPQYMQNTLHLNRGDNMFSEVGFQAGVAATEWSWGVLAADFDMDGRKDLYITNGILGATNDMDYINFISQDYVQREIKNEEITLDFMKYIPQKKTQNYAFRNNGDISFSNVTNKWFKASPSFSNGSAYGDLDNDGDLDLVVNNANQKAFIFENRTRDKKKYHYIKFRFEGSEYNRFGIGSRIEVYSGDLYVYEEHFPVKSYLSSVPNEIVVGLDNRVSIDSLRITWPDLLTETRHNINVDQTLILDHRNAKKINRSSLHGHASILCNSKTGLDFKHHEEATLDFDRDPLIPFALSNEGPGISISDINNDSLDDIFISGGKMQSSALYLQLESGDFVIHQSELFSQHAKSEDVDHVFLDVDNDGDADLLVVSGGNEFTYGEPLKPRLYINESGRFRYDSVAFAGVIINASVVKAIDINNDGYSDVVIGSNSLPGRFGEPASNLIFMNDGNGIFTDVTISFSKDFRQVGLINDLAIADIDGNGFSDIVAVGDWMPLTIFFNDGKVLKTVSIPDTEGWWNTLALQDFDNDGDLDIVAGNWGHNTRLMASIREPIELFRSDFDDNGTIETLITYYYKGKRTVLASKDELHKQMPFIKKKFLFYNDFARANVEDIFSKEKLKSAMRKEVKVLSTSYFENVGANKFKIHILPAEAQQSSVNKVFVDDFDADGFMDVLLVGNNYEISTQLGRLDASHGVLLLNDQAGYFKSTSNQNFNIAGPARDIGKIIIRGNTYYVVTINNNRPIFLKKCI
ncbi:MAG: VCBS repeat-containing protein [Cyclobacteriaceae bacterium]|nr:VCBS repeat-containing protein [Cyclobacteriaceae bacterium]